MTLALAQTLNSFSPVSIAEALNLDARPQPTHSVTNDLLRKPSEKGGSEREG